MAIREEILNELLAGYSKPEDLLGADGIIQQLKKALVEKALSAELTNHLGYDKGDTAGRGTGNSRNGHSRKTVKTDTSAMELNIPRDRNSTFEPLLIKKGQTRFDGFDDKIISMYARGMTVRNIQAHLKELYAVDVSADLISQVTDAVVQEVREWQNRPIDPVYPIIIFDALRVKIRDEGVVKTKSIYLALAFTMEGQKDVLGLWIEQTEGAKFWLKIMNELKNRGVQDVLIAVVDGLKGFPDAINTVFPKTQVQTCIVHLVRYSLNFVCWRDRKDVAKDLKLIYRAETEEMAEANLSEFEAKWDSKYPTISQSWRRNWERVIPFFIYPHEIRKIIYTTNAIESLNMTLRKIIKNRGHFPSDESATKLIYLALRNATTKWTMPLKDWKKALTQFAIIYKDRGPFFGV
ncbi:MAG: IS256 family transposase [Desulfomonilaceae bacterium]